MNIKEKQVVCFASNNKGKIKELQALMSDKYEIKPMGEFGIYDDIEETGVTYIENAKIKAEFVYNKLNKQYPVIADDSGFEIHKLNNEPGVYSARWAGDHDENANLQKALDLLGNTQRRYRGASYVTVLYFIVNDDLHFESKGELFGYVTKSPRGENGFSYDKIFEVEYDRFKYNNPRKFKTIAELTLEEKNAFSHRRYAVYNLFDKILEYEDREKEINSLIENNSPRELAISILKLEKQTDDLQHEIDEIHDWAEISNY